MTFVDLWCYPQVLPLKKYLYLRYNKNQVLLKNKLNCSFFNMNQVPKVLFKVSRSAYYLIVLLVPLFFLPITAEFLEYNKQFLLYGLILVSLLAWIGGSVAERRFEFRRTPLDLPFLALWAIFLASSLASKDRHLSFLGNFENLNLSFVSVTFFILLYFLTTNIVTTAERVRMVFGAAIISGATAILYFFLQYFGLLAKIGWPYGISNPVAPLSTQFSLYLLTLVIISLNALFIPRKKRLCDVLWCLLFLLTLLTIIVIGFKLVWIVTAVGLFILLVFAISRLEDLRTTWISAGFSVFVMALLFTLLGTPSFLTLKLPLEVALSQSVTWRIVTQSLSENVLRFVLGSGPSTFAYSFTQFRPETFNTTIVWNTRFTQGASTFLDMLGTTGFLGMVAFVVIVLLSLGTILYLWTRRPSRGARRTEVSGDTEGLLLPASTTVWLVLLLVSCVSALSTSLWVLFIAMLGITMTLSRAVLAPEAKPWSFSLRTSPQYSLASSFGFILLFSAVVVLGGVFGRYYAANIAYTRTVKAVNKGDYVRATQEAGRAVNLEPANAMYNLVLAQSYLLQAAVEVNKAEPNAGQLTNYLAYAVNSAREATTLSPSSVVAWESLATMYANARGVAPDANDWVVRSLNKAIELESTNPVHFLRRGSAKAVAGDLDGAKKDYEEAIRLKADYADAYASLALLEEQRKDLDSAVVQMVNAARFANQNPDILFQVGRLAYNRNKEGDMQLAEQAFLLAIQQNPNHANALYSLGLLYERQGKRSEAMDYFRRVQRLNPQNEDVRKKIDSLQAPVIEESE